VDADFARQTMQSLIDWINAPTQDVIHPAPGITPANLTVQILTAPATISVCRISFRCPSMGKTV
jgi:hypothetical protein